MGKRYVSLAARTARKWLLLAGVLALGGALLLTPRWLMEGRVRTAMRKDGLTSQGELLWRGQVAYPYGLAYVTVRGEAGWIYAGRLETYESRPYTIVQRYQTPEGPLVTLVGYDVFTSGSGQTLAQVMALSLPEGAVRGELAVELAPGAVRAAESQREQEAMVFSLTCQWEDIYRDGQRIQEQSALNGATYVLTLWDRTGAVVGRTGGTLGSIWR